MNKIFLYNIDSYNNNKQGIIAAEINNTQYSQYSLMHNAYSNLIERNISPMLTTPGDTVEIHSIKNYKNTYPDNIIDIDASLMINTYITQPVSIKQEMAQDEDIEDEDTIILQFDIDDDEDE